MEYPSTFLVSSGTDYVNNYSYKIQASWEGLRKIAMKIFTSISGHPHSTLELEPYLAVLGRINYKHLMAGVLIDTYIFDG